MIDHLVEKWKAIEGISQKLEVFLGKDEHGLKNSSLNLNDEYYFQESVEAILMRESLYRVLLAETQNKVHDFVPQVILVYNIRADRLQGIITSSLQESEVGLPSGFTVLGESWMQAYSLIEGGNSVKSNQPGEHHSAAKGVSSLLSPLKDSAFGQFHSSLNGIPIFGHSLQGGGLSLAAANNNIPERNTMVSPTTGRIFEGVERALMTPSPSATVQSDGSSNYEVPKSTQANESIVNGEKTDMKITSAINTLEVKYGKKRKVAPPPPSSSKRTAHPTRKSDHPDTNAAELDGSEPPQQLHEKLQLDLITPVSPPGREKSRDIEQPSPKKSRTTPAEDSVLPINTILPDQDRQCKCVRFQAVDVASVSHLSPEAKATVRAVASGHIRVPKSLQQPPQPSALIEPAPFLADLCRVGRSRPELRRIKPTLISSTLSPR